MAGKLKLKKNKTKETQAARFKKTARKIGADETGEKFKETIKKLFKPKLHQR